MVSYEIIATGSAGNALLLDGCLLIDCGVAFKHIKPFMYQIRLVLLTHIHGDHFRPSTLKALAYSRPTLRFSCCEWLVKPLAQAGVAVSQIDVLDIDAFYDYGFCRVSPVELVHDVPNCGYRIFLPSGKVFYATDTKNLNGISAPNYDLYLVEANRSEAEIKSAIAEKKADGEYAYEKRVMQTHLSLESCNNFIYRNIGPTGQYVYLHGHVDRERRDQ